MNNTSLARRFLTRAIWTVCLCASLSACARLADLPGLRPTEIPYYRPPTAAAALPSVLAPIQSDKPATPIEVATPTPACTDNLTFIEDQTIPDGTLVQPGEALDKRWLVQNSGTCNWDDSYHLKLIAGAEMGVSTEQALYPARIGAQATIRLVFTAPEQPDAYRSAWQAYSPSGEPFGDPIFIEVLVAPAVGAP